MPGNGSPLGHEGLWWSNEGPHGYFFHWRQKDFSEFDDATSDEVNFEDYEGDCVKTQNELWMLCWCHVMSCLSLVRCDWLNDCLRPDRLSHGRLVGIVYNRPVLTFCQNEDSFFLDVPMIDFRQEPSAFRFSIGFGQVQRTHADPFFQCSGFSGGGGGGGGNEEYQRSMMHPF